jgi:hypothetical protein
MMPSLEYVVRPFQLQQVSFPVLLETESIIADPVVVHLAHLGGAVTFPWSNSLSESNSSNYREVSRQTKTVRVENPDDPSQFVNVERTKQITVGEEQNPKNTVSWTLNDPPVT